MKPSGLGLIESASAMTKVRDLGDQDLVRACIAGDEDAWHLFVDRYYGFIVNVARKALRKAGADDPVAAAEDVASELLAELLAEDSKALTRFREPFSLKSWLAVIARRKASRFLRRAYRDPLQLEEPTHVGAGNRSVASDLVEVERFATIRDRLDDLAPRDRLALQLFYEGGHSYKEVARILDLPVARIGTLLARARKRLAKLLGA